jgi:hypothetical protein
MRFAAWVCLAFGLSAVVTTAVILAFPPSSAPRFPSVVAVSAPATQQGNVPVTYPRGVVGVTAKSSFTRRGGQAVAVG